MLYVLNIYVYILYLTKQIIVWVRVQRGDRAPRSYPYICVCIHVPDTQYISNILYMLLCLYSVYLSIYIYIYIYYT